MSNKRKELGNFLRARRTRLNPEDFGIERTTRRRTEGLRREEVASLANISITLYTKLEQGRDIKTSNNILKNIAKALRLNPFETTYLLMLSDKYPHRFGTESFTEIDPTYLTILDGIKDYPALILDPMWSVVAWNGQAGRVFGDFSNRKVEDKNVLYKMFTDAEMKKFVVDWQDEAKSLVSTFRPVYAEHIEDEAFTTLVENLCNVSEEFKEIWLDYEIGEFQTKDKLVYLPIVGHLTFVHKRFSIDELPGYSISLFVPKDSLYTECALKSLEAILKTVEKISASY